MLTLHLTKTSVTDLHHFTTWSISPVDQFTNLLIV